MASKDWEFVRDVVIRDVNDDVITTKEDPQTGGDMYTTNITCGRSAFSAASTTKTATVPSGSDVGFRVMEKNSIQLYIIHPGPAQIYLSRAPNDDLAHYQGDGGFFKIATIGPANDTEWTTRDQSEVHFKIPATMPPGKYLLRIEHLWPQDIQGRAQWYINCAHAEITGSGGGTPREFVRFPGTYNETDPGILIPLNMSFVYGATGLLAYRAPGPDPWSG